MLQVVNTEHGNGSAATLHSFLTSFGYQGFAGVSDTGFKRPIARDVSSWDQIHREKMSKDVFYAAPHLLYTCCEL